MSYPVPSPAADMTLDQTKILADRTRTKIMQLEEFNNELSKLGNIARAPTQVYLEEKPIHTAIAYLMSAGRTRKEIEKITGVSTTTISHLTAQPWFRTRLKEITDAAGKDMVKAFLEGEVIPSLEVLRTIRDDPSQKGPTRVAASNSLLDRHLGKPVAHIESQTNLNIHTAAEARDQVESELERINRELSERGVKTSSAN